MATKMSRIARFTNMEGSENDTRQEFYTVCGRRHYNNISLQPGGNWAQHKDRVAVPFRFEFLLLPKKLPCILCPTEQGTLYGVLDQHSLAITMSPRYTLASRMVVPNVPHCVGSPTKYVADRLHLFCPV